MKLNELAKNLYKLHVIRIHKQLFGQLSYIELPIESLPTYEELPEENQTVWIEYAKLQLMPEEFVSKFEKEKE